MSSLLNIGSSALAAAQGSLATISHNIANANTAGYSRQDAQLATAGGLYTGAGFFGRGVDVATVQRQYDQFLTQAVQGATAASAGDAARAEGLRALDAVFGDGEQGIGASLDSFFAAAGDLANRPADLSVRQVFLARAGQFASLVSGVGQRIRDVGATADSQLAQRAGEVNTHLGAIRRLNEQIARAATGGQPPNDLLDQRDQEVQALSSLMAVSRVPQDDGSIALFTKSGAPLLVGSQQATLSARPDPTDPSLAALQLDVGGTARWLDAGALGGGSLAGLMRLRDEDVAGALRQVGRIAQVVASAVNAQQALGVDTSGAAGQALFSIGGPASLPNAANTGSGVLTTTVSNAGALVASDYELSFAGGNYTIQRLSDGSTTTSSTLPASVDGLTFSATGTPAAGDRWQIRPFDAAATGLAARPLTARQLATGYAATVAAAPGNQGGASASGFAIVQPGANNALPVTITFNTPPTSFNVTGLASGNLTNVPYTPGQPVPAAPASYNGWTMTLDGTPAAGDRFDVRANAAPGSDNRNMLALGALAGAGLVAGQTLGDAYASLVADVGARVQAGQAAEAVSARLRDDAVTRQQNVAGVNLDEEASNLLRFQQAYQASARIVQASQSLFDALIAATGR